MVAGIKIIQQGESMDFSFDRGGESITGWTCLIEAKIFPDDVATISRTILPTDGVWSGYLTATETAVLDVGTWYLIAKLTDGVTDEAGRVPIRFHVSRNWI